MTKQYIVKGTNGQRFVVSKNKEGHILISAYELCNQHIVSNRQTIEVSCDDLMDAIIKLSADETARKEQSHEK